MSTCEVPDGTKKHEGWNQDREATLHHPGLLLSHWGEATSSGHRWFYQALLLQGTGACIVRVQWESNTKAWMMSSLFLKWLEHLNNKMYLQARHILLFLYNWSAHLKIELSHIKLVFLPKNTTSQLQPCDAGIVNAVKLMYHKKMLHHLLHHMDECTPAQELAMKIDVLDVIC